MKSRLTKLEDEVEKQQENFSEAITKKPKIENVDLLKPKLEKLENELLRRE